MNDLDKAAMAEYENDLKGMEIDEVEREISRVEDIINEEEPWLEALCAYKRKLERDAK